jgi:hypothetical protein
MIIEPFYSKLTILIKVVSCSYDIANFECAATVDRFKTFTEFPKKYVVLVNWKRQIMKAIGPLSDEEVPVVVKSEVELYGPRKFVACGDPNKEVILQLRY